jgi:hypothetical protein
LLDEYRARCLAHLAGSAPLIDTIPTAAARAFAGYAGVWADAVLAEPLGNREPELNLAQRLKSHRFRAWRYAIGRRLDPRVLAALAGAVPVQSASDAFAAGAPDPVPQR